MRFLVPFLILAGSCFSQDFSNITSKTNTYTNITRVEDLAEKIGKDFSSDEDKVKAVFCWLTSNIRYDLEEYYNPSSKRTAFRYRTEEEKEKILQDMRDNLVAETLISKKAVCEGYAQAFTKICDLLDIESEVIKGNTRFGYLDIGKPKYESNHAWNAVKINDEWKYFDATWGAGSVVNGAWKSYFKPYYYDIPKQHYFKTHFPEKSIWKLRIGRITTEEFYNQPIYMDGFLESDVTLIYPQTGIIKKDQQGNITIKLKNASAKNILLGFLGSNIAKRPTINSLNEITTITFLPPPHAQECFLLIDREAAIQFLIQ